MSLDKNPVIIVAITGASGVALGLHVLRALGDVGAKRHLVLSPAGKRTLLHECPQEGEDLSGLAETRHAYKDIGAAPASGSFLHAGMIVAPCSIKSASEIAYGLSGNLVARAADVTLKERRKLILAVRESPLHYGHLSTLARLAQMGASICPAVPPFYHGSMSIAAMLDAMAYRYLDLLGLYHPKAQRWQPERPA